MNTSVIVVNFNGGASLVPFSRALLTQLAADDELIIVDNGSTDDSVAMLRREIPQARLIIEDANRGYASGVNRGLANAEGEVLIVLNPDALPEPGSLQVLARVARDHSDYFILGGTLLDERGRVQRSCARPLPEIGGILREGLFLPLRTVAGFSRLDSGEDGIVDAGAVSGAAMALLRENYTQLGPMDDEYFLYNEDVEWCDRAHKRGGKVGVVARARFVHQGGETTRKDESYAFAARVLADFQYFVEVRGKKADTVRRKWLTRLRVRSWLYGADARFGILGKRPGSAQRAAINRRLRRSLAMFAWAPDSRLQNAHPHRLLESVTKRRVLHIITRLIVGGAQENTIASVEKVNNERYESHLWIGPETGTEGSLVESARQRGIEPVIIPNMVRRIAPVKDALVTVQLARLMRRFHFDIVHTHSSKGGIVGRFAARLAGVPVIVHTVHGWGFHERMSRWNRKFYVLLERATERYTHRLISVSDRTTAVGLEEGISSRQKYVLIRSGIPLKTFYPDDARRTSMRQELGIADGAIVVGTVGRLSAQKNPLDFVRVAEQLLSNHPSAHFVYVGDGPLRSEFEAAVDRAGIGNRVTLLGLRHDVPDLLRAFDLFILTSLWEGLPRVVPQALTTGVPVIAYATSGIEEIVISDRNGFVVPMGDADQMVQRLVRVIEDGALQSRLAHNASMGFDTSFSEDTMVSQLESLYDELITKHAMP